jgi:hypothetical protein
MNNTIKSHLLSYEVNVQLDMLRSLMMNMICTQVDRKNHCGFVNNTKEFTKQLSKPIAFSNRVSHHTILSISTTSRDSRLSLKGPAKISILSNFIGNIGRYCKASSASYTPISCGIRRKDTLCGKELGLSVNSRGRELAI